MRNRSVDLTLEGCRVDSDLFKVATCDTLEDLPDINCKIYEDQVDHDGNPGAKQTCLDFDDVVVMCEAGVCKNVSQVYDCQYESTMEAILGGNDGLGECFCSLCPENR